MKNICWLPTLMIVCSLAIGCKKESCSKSIATVQPNANPAGYEVLIKTNGFTSAAKVVFGSVAATSRAGGEAGDLIAKVPAGLSGNVEISVEEGDCIARSGGFTVLGALPSGVQPSLPNIIVPTTTTTTPTGIGNEWSNAAATSFDGSGIPEQGLTIVEFPSSGDMRVIDPALSHEFDKSVSNPLSGSANLGTREVHLVIDRTGNGGSTEHFDGQFIKVPDSVPADATDAILLVSRETGRQLLIYHK